MTKVPMEKPPHGMGTLDKLWGTIHEEDDDTTPMETEEKTEEESTTYEPKTAETSKQQTKTTKNHNSSDTTPLFPTTIRFRIEAPTTSVAATQHFNILKMIDETMEYCEIYSKDTKKLNKETLAPSDFEYNEQGNNKKQFIVVHRLVLDQKYHHIKKNKAILDCIKTNNCHIQEHHWSTREWDIVNIGFLCNVSPKHQSKDTVLYKLKTIEETKLRFNLHATQVTCMHEGNKHSTLAYQIQCQRNQSEEVSKYIANTCKEHGQTFIKYKWKYTNPKVFINAVRQQNDFIDNIRTIPVYGITNTTMANLTTCFLKKKEILEVGTTSKTLELGRWNMYTKLSNFRSTTKWLQLNLPKMFDDLDNDLKLETPPNFTPEVRFNTTIIFDEMDDPLLQYAIHTTNSRSDNSTQDTCTSETSMNRTWASVASTSKDPSSITTTSELSKMMQKLSDSISTICTRLDNIEETLHKHEEAINQAQRFESECNTNMQKLVAFIEKLEDRTVHLKPRKLDNYYDSFEPNKRQNTNTSPQKTPPS